VPKKTEQEKADALRWKLAKWGISGTKKRAAIEFQKMIRYESADVETGLVTCVTCGYSDHWKNTNMKFDAGHFVGGRTNSTQFLEDNCHAQCVHCNQYQGGRLNRYEAWMIERYGKERVHELKVLRNQTVKFTAEQLNEMRLGYVKRWKAAEKKLIEAGH